MTTTEMLDKILPYTKEENRCGIKKAAKGMQRMILAEKIRKLRKKGFDDSSILKMLQP